MCFGGGGDGGAAQARADEQARQERVRKGVSNINRNFEGFNTGFFDSRSDAYKNFAMPQVNQAFQNNADQVAYSLARSGLTSSSEAARRQGILQSDNALARQQVYSNAAAERQRAMQAVEDNRNNLINQVQSTSDATLAGQNALRQAQVLTSQANNFNPIANLFANTTGMLAAANQAGAYSGGPGLGAYKEYFGFGGGSSKPRVVS